MLGWIINRDDDRYTREEHRAQAPAFLLDDGTPIFEVWFFVRRVNRWFVMAMQADPTMVQNDVIYFLPGDTTSLHRWITHLLIQQRTQRTR